MEDHEKSQEQIINELSDQHAQCACHDVAQNKETQEAEQETRTRYEALFQNVSDGVAVYKAVNDGEDFVFVEFNKAAEKTTGFSCSEVIGKRVSEVFPGVKDVGLFDRLKAVWTTGEPAHHPVSRYVDSKIQIWVDNHVSRLSSGEIVAVFRDITSQKQAEDALKATTDLLKILADSLPVGILYVDAARIAFANNTFASWWGKPGEDLSGFTVKDLFKLLPGHTKRHSGSSNWQKNNLRKDRFLRRRSDQGYCDVLHSSERNC